VTPFLHSWTAADIVRIENGRLAEHWDVLQDEATKAESKSGRRCLAITSPPDLTSVSAFQNFRFQHFKSTNVECLDTTPTLFPESKSGLPMFGDRFTA
jgi:hypothetical protein